MHVKLNKYQNHKQQTLCSEYILLLYNIFINGKQLLY